MERMENNKLPKRAVLFRPRGRRNVRRPERTWSDPR
jgi:hypothetical protein